MAVEVEKREGWVVWKEEEEESGARLLRVLLRAAARVRSAIVGVVELRDWKLRGERKWVSDDDDDDESNILPPSLTESTRPSYHCNSRREKIRKQFTTTTTTPTTTTTKIC